MNGEESLVLWLLYRSSVRVERKLDRLLNQQQEQAQLLKLARGLKKSTDRLKHALESQNQISSPENNQPKG